MEIPSTPQFHLEGRELLEHLVERAAQQARAEVLAREERRNRTLMTVIALLGLVGVGAVMGGLKLLIAGEMQVVDQRVAAISHDSTVAIAEQIRQSEQGVAQRVRTEVLADVVDDLGDVRRQLALNSQFEEYSELAGRLSERLRGLHSRHDRFVASVLAETMAAIRAVAAEPELTSRSRFLVVTREIVGILVRFNRVAEIDELDELLGPILRSDAELAESLVDHYGQLVIGSPLKLADQSNHVARLERYADAVGHTPHTEKKLVWKLFVEFKRNGMQRTLVTDGLLESSQDLPPESREQFWLDLYKYSDLTLWLLSPDQQGRELQRLMEALVARYPVVREMMERTVASNPSIQQMIAKRRLTVRSARATAGQPVDEPTQEEPAAATPATANAAANGLRR